MCTSFLKYCGLVAVNTAIVSLTDVYAAAIAIPAVWLAYLELEVGGILIRQDSTGKKVLTPSGIVPMLQWPLIAPRAWCYDYLDINFYAVLGGTSIASALL